MKRIALFSKHAEPQTIEHEIDNRCGVESEELAHDESSNNRDTKRAAQLRTCTCSKRQRQGAEERGHGGHENWAEAQHTRFKDGVFGALATFPFGLKSKIDHHDGILLDDTDKQDNSDDGDDVKVFLEENQSEHGTDASRRKRRNDRERVHQTFVQDSKNDVDSQERR